jgi:hypothetical protein
MVLIEENVEEEKEVVQSLSSGVSYRSDRLHRRISHSKEKKKKMVEEEEEAWKQDEEAFHFPYLVLFPLFF